MTISSMTGYAVSNRDSEAGSITLEIRSVNSRFLDLQFRINDDLRMLEPMLRETISARVSRGKVECRLSFGRKERVTGLAANEELLSALQNSQQSVLTKFPDASPLSVNELLRWPGVLHEAELSQDTLQADVQATLKAALDAFVESRQREGAALMTMLLSRIDEIEAIVARITPLVPAAVEQFQQKAIDRLREAMGLAVADGKPSLTTEEMHERIRQEVTLYGIRVDVAEELTRLSGHLAETREILKKGGQVGKRLDFMMQELNREANTLGSKAAVKALSDASMQMKLLIEQMREQVQNLE
ncbi:MAG: YicC/YloC family endoribonuclease [Burkholderiaceae bacterium]